MITRLSFLVALAMVLAACRNSPAAPHASPTPAATATEVVTVPSPSNSSTSGKGIVTAPDPVGCGADKLMPYLNLLPTSTAKNEIARTVGHNRIRYVEPGQPTTRDFRPDRLTVTLGVDGRIKQFRCG
jgi:hypothetical protein